MQFTMTVQMDNAAFEDATPAFELHEILLNAAERIGDGRESGVCFDTNGNNVGTWEVTA